MLRRELPAKCLYKNSSFDFCINTHIQILKENTGCLVKLYYNYVIILLFYVMLIILLYYIKYFKDTLNIKNILILE